MTKERFIDRNFTIGSRSVIQQANKIITEYQAMGFKLTLRQLYYQFVARDLIANKQSEYKRLGRDLWDEAEAAETENKEVLETVTDHFEGVKRYAKYRDFTLPYTDEADDTTVEEALVDIAGRNGDDE